MRAAEIRKPRFLPMTILGTVKPVMWWCRISMRLSAADTDAAYADLEKFMPEIGQAVADKLGLRVQQVRVDNWIIIPCIKKDEETTNRPEADHAGD